MTFEFYYIWWMIDIVSVRYKFHSIYINMIKMRQTDYCFLKHCTLVGFHKSANTACFLAIQTIRQWKWRNFEIELPISVYFQDKKVINIWKFKPRVSVFHCDLICFNIRDLIISPYRYKHHILSYNIIDMSAALKITNFDKTSINYRPSESSFHMHL